VYEDDNLIIPKNTSVLVSRRPATRAGKGTAQRYLGVNLTGMGGVAQSTYNRHIIQNKPGSAPFPMTTYVLVF
jgi:hypothetical protein